jgi:hypothetical protein
MFAVLPFGDDYIKDDALFFDDLEDAYQEALDWSVQLDGRIVNVYEFYKGKFNNLAKAKAQVFA